MFTLDPVRRIPADDAGTPDIDPVADQEPRPDSGDVTDIRRLVTHDLDEADSAIRAGRIEDAHRALIHAQDVVFDRHLEAIASQTLRWPSKNSTDLFLRLTNRLIDANRCKDRAIVAECRLLLDLMADTYAIGRTVSSPTPS